ncbi:MAG: InlB B-repeat-containing protein, partial [Oscillospiraceae bacterium]|nr:InlB B-repeat-containing protein [Oscillospiraceae bacterium]
VTFEINDGSGAVHATKSADANTALGTGNMPTDPTRSGYAFVGWNTRNDGNGTAFDGTTPVTADITVYAAWDDGTQQPTTYTVTFKANGGRFADNTTADKTVTVNAGSAVGAGNVPTVSRSGHTFEGWYDDTGNEFDPAAYVTSNITVSAKWEKVVVPVTYKVTFRANGGNFADNTTIKTANVVPPATTVGTNMPADPTRSGYTFAGWNTAANGSGTAFTASTAVTANIIVYAQWTPSGTQPVTYEVTYDANGGTGSQSDADNPYASGDEVTVLGKGTMARTGYTFAGWNTLANGNGTAYDPDDTFYMPDHDVTLYAVWDRVVVPVTYTVTFKANYGANTTLATRTVNAGEAIGAANMPADPVRSGYTFTGWNRAANGSGTAFTASTAVTANITVYAQWTADATHTQKVTICFDSNGGIGSKLPVTVDKGDTYILPVNPFTREGYSFAGWKINNAGSTLAVGTTITVNENITLYAQWEIAPNNSLVGGVYIPIIIGGTNYGSSISETEVVFDKNSSGDITVMVVSGNSSWVGDYKLQCLKNKNRMLVNGVDYTVNGDIVTIKASYLKTLSVGEQTITFVMNGGVDPKLNINIVDRAP